MMREANSLLSPAAMQQYNLINKQVGQTSSVNQMKDAYNNTAIGKWRQFKTTLTDIGQSLGMMLLPSLTKTLTLVSNVLAKMLNWSIAHPKIAKMIGTVLGLGAAFLTLGGSMMMIMGFMKYLTALNGGLNMLKVMGIATSGVFKMLFSPVRLAVMLAWRTALIAIRVATLAWRGAVWLLSIAMDANPIGMIVTGIGLLIIVIVTLIDKWRTVVRWLKVVWDWIKNLSDRFNHLSLGVKLLLDVLAPFIAIPATIIANWKPISHLFQQIGNDIGHAANAMGGFFSHVFGGASINIPTGSMSTGGMAVHVHPGAIQINGAGQNADQIANQVIQKLGNSARVNNMSTPYRPNKYALGH